MCVGMKTKAFVHVLTLGAAQWAQPSNKHHCRHCKRRVCSKHFAPSQGNITRSATEPPLCTVCIAAGVTTW